MKKVLFLKSHIDTYTRKDGVVVNAHDDKRQKAAAPDAPLKKGDRIHIKPAFQDAGDDKYEWVVCGDEEKGRVNITPLGTGLSIPPNHVVKREWIERA